MMSEAHWPNDLTYDKYEKRHEEEDPRGIKQFGHDKGPAM